MPQSRKVVDIRRAQFEIPGFTAGAVGVLVDEALMLCGHQVKRYGPTLLMQGIVERLQQARASVNEWTRTAQMVTDYDCARDAVAGKEG